MQLVTSQGFAPKTMTEAIQFSEMLSKSAMVPRQYQGKPEDVLVAVQWGYEIGLAPLQALQNISVINGKPSVYGDAAMALVQASPVCDGVEEHIENEGTANPVAVCIAKRKGRNPVIARFSVEDAKRAGLWGKQGPWQAYPKRMLQMRARGFALRDAFPDVLKGLITAEEAHDYPQEKDVSAQIQVPKSVQKNPLDAIKAPVTVAVDMIEQDVAVETDPQQEYAQIEEVNQQLQEEAAQLSNVALAGIEQIKAQFEEAGIEVVDIETVKKPEAMPWQLYVPGKDAEGFDSYELWSQAYESMCDKVASAGKAKADTRLQKLAELRQANEPVFIKLDAIQRVEMTRRASARKQKLEALLAQ